MFIAILGTIFSLAAETQTAGEARCSPHYVSQTCVPIARDVDCAGGPGNGPAYVEGPFKYRGEDVYGLDPDHDWIACEPPPRH